MVKFANFIDETTKKWNSYYSNISSLIENGIIKTKHPLIFPTIAVFIDYSEFYVVEFIGFSPTFKPLAVRRQESKTIQSYTSMFGGAGNNSAMHLHGSGSGISGFNFGIRANMDEASSIFSFLKSDPNTTNLLHIGNARSFFSFDDDFKAFEIEKCNLVETQGAFSRARAINLSYIFRSSVNQSDVRKIYDDYLYNTLRPRRIAGVFPNIGPSFNGLWAASQLQSLVRLQGLHENTIGTFIVDNPDIAKGAFDCISIRHEFSLPWLEHDGTVDDFEIRPDLFLQRRDGSFDICDFKLAKLDKKSLTRGSRKRRRFVDYINEGISQLNNYKYYFSFRKNLENALHNHGIYVNNPRLILIAGSYENINKQEVLEACRSFQDVTIIDYDSLSSMFISSAMDQKH